MEIPAWVYSDDRVLLLLSSSSDDDDDDVEDEEAEVAFDEFSGVIGDPGENIVKVRAGHKVSI